jgi:tetratricopeptide (TPR) repeat protein
MGLRALGIGPEGSLLAAGAVRAEDRVLVADVAAPAGDSALAPILAEAVRTAMGQSRALRLVGPDEVATTLGQMRRPPGTRLEGEVAREVAQRLGAPLLLGGRVARVGGGYVVSLDLSPAAGGAALASYQAAAADAQGLLGAVDELARKLRGRVGESLRLVQRAVPLEQATTSLPRRAPQVHAGDRRARQPRRPDDRDPAAARGGGGRQHLRARLAQARRGRPTSPGAAVRDSALEQALRWSDRLPDRERDLVRGSYYLWHSRAADEGKAIDALRAAYRADSSMPVPINLLAGLYERLGQYDSVARYTQRGLLVRRAASGAARHASTLLRLGRVDEAERVLDSLWRADTLWRRDWFAAVMRSDLRLARGDRDSAYAIAAALARGSAAADVQARALVFVAREALIRGRLREAVAFAGAADSLVAAQGGVPLDRVFTRTWADAWLLGRRAEAVHALDSLLADARWLRAVAPADRPYASFGITYARAGRADRAEAMLARVRAEQPALERITPGLIRALRAEIAAARGDYPAAHALTRARRPLEATTSPDDQFAEAFVLDQMDRRDSALVALRALPRHPAGAPVVRRLPGARGRAQACRRAARRARGAGAGARPLPGVRRPLARRRPRAAAGGADGATAHRGAGAPRRVSAAAADRPPRPSAGTPAA